MKMKNVVFVVASLKMTKLFHNCHVIKNIFFAKFVLMIGLNKTKLVHCVEKHFLSIK